MRHKLISLSFIVCILFLMPMTVFAQKLDYNRCGSISVTLEEMEGAELSLYYLAEVNLNSDDNLSFSFTEEFEKCGVSLDDSALAEKMDAYVEEHAAPVMKQVTEANGKVVFSNLPLGLYYVKQTNIAPNYAPCKSFLATVPNKDIDTYVYDVNASPKTDVEKLTSVTIKKVWNTDKSTPIADSVTVHLLRDGVVVETAILNEQNNWQVTYTDLPESDVYSIVEKNVPKGFTATYSQSGYVFTVTNSAALIQTGQLTWPIPILAIAGLVFIAVGTIILRKTRYDNE